MNSFYKVHPQLEMDEVKLFLLKNIHYLGEKLFSKHFPELYKDISQITFPFPIKKFSQKLYHMVNMDIGVWKLGLCKMCGRRCNFGNFNIGYLSYCCPKCAGADPEVNAKNKQTNILLYGEDYTYKRSKKSVQTFKSLGEEAKLRKIKKTKETKLLHFGDENYNNPKQQKATMIKRYGGVGFGSKQVMEKYLNTLKEKYNDITYRNQSKNGETLKELHQLWKNKFDISNPITSLLEINVYDFLIDLFGKEDIIPQYKSTIYPFYCDFYIKSLDLYIEIQGHPSHGPHPFDKTNIEDINCLNEYKAKHTKYYDKIIEVWTVRDVNKRNIAKENKLNYLEVFTTDIEKCKDIINTYITKMMLCQK